MARWAWWRCFLGLIAVVRRMGGGRSVRNARRKVCLRSPTTPPEVPERCRRSSRGPADVPGGCRRSPTGPADVSERCRRSPTHLADVPGRFRRSPTAPPSVLGTLRLLVRHPPGWRRYFPNVFSMGRYPTEPTARGKLFLLAGANCGLGHAGTTTVDHRPRP